MQFADNWPSYQTVGFPQSQVHVKLSARKLFAATKILFHAGHSGSLSEPEFFSQPTSKRFEFESLVREKTKIRGVENISPSLVHKNRIINMFIYLFSVYRRSPS